MKGLIRIINKNKLLAFIIKADFKKKGAEFLTPNEFPQQLAYINHPKGHVINPHIHASMLKQIKFTQEVLFIKKGKVRIDFYDSKKHYIESRIIENGDIVFLAFGGHGFEFIKDTDMIEIKQGPFFKNIKPVRFDAIPKEKLKLRK